MENALTKYAVLTDYGNMLHLYHLITGQNEWEYISSSVQPQDYSFQLSTLDFGGLQLRFVLFFWVNDSKVIIKSNICEPSTFF
jgi:hypothetical protein